MDTERLKEIAKAIRNSQRFRLDTFCDGNVLDLTRPECQSVGCVAGWAVAIYGDGDRDIFNEATKILDLTDEQATQLFFAGNKSVWRDFAKYSFLTTSYTNITTNEAADVLDQIADGKIVL